MGLSANQWLGLLNGDVQARSDLQTDRSKESDTLSQKNAALQELFEQITAENANLDSLEAERAEIEKENPDDKMYGGIKEFVLENQGMCGMGMGMGSLKDSCMQLTGKELKSLSCVLGQNGNGKLSVCDMVGMLKDMGVEGAKASDDGKAIEITRPDGSKVKICDANGDGMINNCDYDFSDALAKFNCDLAQFEAKVKINEDKQLKSEQTIQSLEAQQAMVQQEADASQSKIDGLDNEIKGFDGKIEMEEVQYQKAVETEEIEAQEIEDTKAQEVADTEAKELRAQEETTAEGNVPVAAAEPKEVAPPVAEEAVDKTVLSEDQTEIDGVVMNSEPQAAQTNEDVAMQGIIDAQDSIKKPLEE